MSDIALIQNRVREVEQQINRYRMSIDGLEKELKELELAARVLARLSGATGDQVGQEDASGTKATGGSGKPEGAPTMPEMIVEVLKQYESVFGDGAEPKAIAREIRLRWWPDVDGAYVSSIMWRMWKRGDLVKHTETATYRLPDEGKTADDKPSRDTSAASLFNHAEGREAGPGGGG
jgi:hypothetical protein